MNLLWPPTANFPKVMDPECKLKSPKSTVKKIIEAKESQKEQAHFTPTSPRKRKKNGSSLDLWMIITNSQMQEYMKSAANRVGHVPVAQQRSCTNYCYKIK